MNNSSTITRDRLLLVAAAAFVSTLVFYLVIYYIYQPLATGAAIAWALVVLIVLFYVDRKRTGMLGLENENRELRAFINLQPLFGKTFVPYGFWAMEANNLQSLLSTIQYNGYRTVVECGAGVSTLLIGNLLRQLGQGHIFSLEEDEKWHAVMTSAIVHEGLADYVTVLHAPLEANADSGAAWYSLVVARQILEQAEQIDLLLVDGPKSIATLSRYPALPFFTPALHQHSLIVLDDSKRTNELAVIKKWGEVLKIDVQQVNQSLRGQAHIRLG
ncbi:MAG: class I SAM-dependent methyltransferase [Chloroflexota bacterium]